MTARKRLVVACPHGFCAGVRRAVDAVEAALRNFPPPVYCFNEIVHNRRIVDDLAGRGVVFVRDVADVPEGAVLLFSAHGVTPAVRAAAGRRGLTVVDATCPFVTKVHSEVKRFAARGYGIVLIGKRGHDEVVGVAGEASEHVTVVESVDDACRLAVPDPSRVAVVTQTTLSVDETEAVMRVLRERFPALEIPAGSDICYATTNRQEAVRRVAAVTDRILVLGAHNSSNTNRLVEVARRAGTPADLVCDLDELAAVPLDEVRAVGVTAGASTPQPFVDRVLERLRAQGFRDEDVLSVADEAIRFTLPAAVRECG